MTSAHMSMDPAQLSDLDAKLVDSIDRIQREELARHRATLRGIALEAPELVDALGGYLEGGKMLRPRFCFWAGVAALGREPDQTELDALARMGAAIEWVQAAALMHDDVMDHSPVRRGRPALHIAAASRHAAEDLSGSAEDFGIAVAIVLGDLALSWAEQLASSSPEGSGVRAEAQLRARAEFDALRTEVMTGQYLDILHQAGGFVSPADAETAALEVIRWKTVPYTVLRPVRMGAALMGAQDDQLDLLSAWAIDVGTAFQLRDDLLSVVGDEYETGKPIGGDVIEGKRTVLLARTLAHADPSAQALIERTVGNPAATTAQIAEVRELMVRSGAVDSVIDDVRTGASRADHRLRAAGALGSLGRAGLRNLAALATDTATLRVVTSP